MNNNVLREEVAVLAVLGYPVSAAQIPVYRELTGKSASVGSVSAIFVLFNRTFSMVCRQIPYAQ